MSCCASHKKFSLEPHEIHVLVTQRLPRLGIKQTRRSPIGYDKGKLVASDEQTTPMPVPIGAQVLSSIKKLDHYVTKKVTVVTYEGHWAASDPRFSASCGGAAWPRPHVFNT